MQDGHRAGAGGAATHVEHIQVRSYLIGADGRAGPAALCRLMQEAALHHAAELGAGVQDLLPAGRSWVLVGTLLRCERLPGLGEVIRVETWPRPPSGRAALRDFILSDGEGRTVALATTSWLVIDLKQRHPVALETVKPGGWPVRRESVLGRDPARLEASEQKEGQAEDAAPAGAVTLVVRRSDLDLLGHVNNAAWVDYALEAVPETWERGRRLRELEVNYLAEARHGDELIARVVPEVGAAGVLLHAVLHARDGRPALRARSVWMPAG